MSKSYDIYDKNKDPTIDVCLNCNRTNCTGKCDKLLKYSKIKPVTKPVYERGVDK